eukprot:COSAG01_NODE_927_length_12693_cov_16.333810_2_plen_43_part_00
MNMGGDGDPRSARGVGPCSASTYTKTGKATADPDEWHTHFSR